MHVKKVLDKGLDHRHRLAAVNHGKHGRNAELLCHLFKRIAVHHMSEFMRDHCRELFRRVGEPDKRRKHHDKPAGKRHRIDGFGFHDHDFNPIGRVLLVRQKPVFNAVDCRRHRFIVKGPGIVLDIFFEPFLESLFPGNRHAIDAF